MMNSMENGKQSASLFTVFRLIAEKEQPDETQ